MYDMILVRFGEMTLKKDNYKQFLKRMIQNIKKKLWQFPTITYANTDYRFYIYLNGTNEEEVIEQLQIIVGIYSFSLCKKTSNDLDEIAKTAIFCLEEHTLPFTFKVETNRANKNYPLTSIQISQEVAKRVLPKVEGLSVDVHHPQVTLAIDLRSEGTYVYTKVIRGLGGYPSGMAGNGLLLISGGIDSPVAGYCCIRKGLKIEAIHYASPPYTSDEALQKVILLMERLCEYTSDGEM
ncbi:MAG: THUMP domain-containing protein, partial [Bacilli bacterium]